MPDTAPAFQQAGPSPAAQTLQEICPGYRLKRPLDVCIAAAGLVLASPLLAVAAVAILAIMGRPILFRQQRAGLGGKVFELYKLRTMKLGSGPDVQRLTRLGRFLRTWGIDELLQLGNVLRGEMSVVGPRPLLAEYLPLYDQQQILRHGVRPGITGWAQVRGRNDLSWLEKFDLDLWYVDHCSLALDLKIMLLTLWRLFRRHGVSQPGHATAERFRGGAERHSMGFRKRDA